MSQPTATCSMQPAELPALPPDVLGCIARAALTAEGSNAQAWARLSLVGRTWLESICGAKLRDPCPRFCQWLLTEQVLSMLCHSLAGASCPM